MYMLGGTNTHRFCRSLGSHASYIGDYERKCQQSMYLPIKTYTFTYVCACYSFHTMQCNIKHYVTDFFFTILSHQRAKRTNQKASETSITTSVLFGCSRFAFFIQFQRYLHNSHNIYLLQSRGKLRWKHKPTAETQMRGCFQAWI